MSAARSPDRCPSRARAPHSCGPHSRSDAPGSAHWCLRWQRWGGDSRGWSRYGYDDLAHGTTLPELANGIAAAFERVPRRDARLDLPGEIPIHELTHVRGVPSRLATHPASPEDADDLAALQQWQIERNARDARRKPDDQKATRPVDRTQRRLRVIPAYRIVD